MDEDSRLITSVVLVLIVGIVAVVLGTSYTSYLKTQEFVKGGYVECTLQGSNYIGWCKK